MSMPTSIKAHDAIVSKGKVLKPALFASSSRLRAVGNDNIKAVPNWKVWYVKISRSILKSNIGIFR